MNRGLMVVKERCGPIPDDGEVLGKGMCFLIGMPLGEPTMAAHRVTA